MFGKGLKAVILGGKIGLKTNANCLGAVWTTSSEFGTYRLCEQRRFRRACASAQSRQNLRCSLIQAVRQEEPSDRKPDPWPLWMAGHAQLKFVMTECSKTQIRLTRLSLIWVYTMFAQTLRTITVLQMVDFSWMYTQFFSKKRWQNTSSITYSFQGL